MREGAVSGVRGNFGTTTMTSWLRTRVRPVGLASLDAVAPWSQRGRSRVVLGSRGERGVAFDLALRVVAGGPLGALCRGKWPDAIMAPATICIALGSSMTATNRKVPPQEQSVTRSPNVRTKSCAHVRLPGRFGEMGRSGASRGGSGRTRERRRAWAEMTPK